MIDYIHTSNPSSFLESGCLDAGVSDHLMVYTMRTGGQCHSHKTKKVRTFKRCNVEALLDDLQSASWELSSTDIDSLWNHWKSTVLDILDSHTSMISCQVRRNPLPWIDTDIRKQMRKQNQLQSQGSKTGSKEAWCSYRNMRNKVTGSLRRLNMPTLSQLLPNPTARV